MTLHEFCTRLSTLGYSHAELALAILFFEDSKSVDVEMSSGQLAKIIIESGLGSANSTNLAQALRKSGKVLERKRGFRLKVIARDELGRRLKEIFRAPPAPIDHEQGYLTEGVWRNTRNYIEKVCKQLNGCYQHEFYDAASVMLRRLVETLLIEAYEKLNRESEIKGASGNYFMLRDLISCALGNRPLTLGRESKEALRKVKELGDRSAHNRRFTAQKADLDRVQSGVRVIADELIEIAHLRSAITRPQA